MAVFFRASESAKPGERLWEMGVYVIRVNNPPVAELMPGFNRLSLLCG